MEYSPVISNKTFCMYTVLIIDNENIKISSTFADCC